MELYAVHPGYIEPYLEAVNNATPEERAAAADMFGSQALPSVLTIDEASRSAAITIAGHLSPNGPSPIARFLGFDGTAYSDIIKAAQEVQDSPAIDTVYLRINTPGGTEAGMGAARKALDELASKKTLVAENHGMIASAGYYLATAAHKIVALSPLAKTGSIGVIVAGWDTSPILEKAGARRVRIVSKNAPYKAPDPATKDGEAEWQQMIDASERVFISAVAQGRGTTITDVEQNFGRGRVLIAKDPGPDTVDALSVGMIDEVSYSHSAPVSSDTLGPSAGPTAFRDLPMVNTQWDSAAAIQRVRRFVGAQDAPNQRYRQAFFWFDSQDSGNFGAYKLPFVDVVDGRLVAVWNGVKAANGAMSGARGRRVDIPAADRPRVQAHIDKYRNKWQRQQQNNGGNAAIGGGRPAFVNDPARDGGYKQGTTMDLEELKANHPAVYDQAVAVGAEKGAAQERERVEAHLTMGEASGDMALAVSCITEGKEMTASVSAKYQAAGMKKAAQSARGAESEGAVDTEVDTGTDAENALALATAAELGVEING